MYKLLLVSDRDEVLDAFAQVQNWEMLGFKPPHIRHDFEGMLDSLSKHHADGIAIAVRPEEEEKIMPWLQEHYPKLSIFEAGATPEEVVCYLTELKTLLNRINADFSNDKFSASDMLQVCRHDYFRRLMRGKVSTRAELYRNLRLLRSRMDPDQPCLLIELTQPPAEDKLTGRWQYGADRLELALRNSFAGDFEGLHILPTVHQDGRILVLACPLKGVNIDMTADSMTAMITAHTADSMQHMKEYWSLELHMTNIKVLPALTALCGDAE